jgi:hypothetical protein
MTTADEAMPFVAAHESGIGPKRTRYRAMLLPDRSRVIEIDVSPTAAAQHLGL